MIFDPLLDLFRGRAITIPPLDGAFGPNTALDATEVFAELSAPDNLVWRDGKLHGTSGGRVLAWDGDTFDCVAMFEASVTALAATPGGGIAVATEDGALTEDGVRVSLPDGVACITALAYGADGTLWLANGSARHPASAWVVDLMEKGASGSVWRRAPGAAFERVAGDLAWPCGLLPEADGIVVSEASRHRLVRVEGTSVTPILSHLPGYPARLAPAPGGAWLAIMAPRNRLIEFVLQDDAYRRDMMAEIPRAFWIAPALSSGQSFLEPLQCGGIRSMGTHKAWSPSRSYGLVVQLDANIAPLRSLHSRADGKRHGVTSALEVDGRLYVASKGGDAVLRLSEAF